MGGALLTRTGDVVELHACEEGDGARPADRRHAWHAMWMSRLAATTSLSEVWLGHQRRRRLLAAGFGLRRSRRDRMRRHGRLRWEDNYSNFVPRLLEHPAGPKLGIVGPWSHAYPCRGAPGPLIGYCRKRCAGGVTGSSRRHRRHE